MEGQDHTAVLGLAKSLVKETAVLLKDFSVVHAQPDTCIVVLHCWHVKQLVLASIAKMHLEDYFRRDRLTGKQANLVVDRNLDVSARIISSKYERGEYRPYFAAGLDLPARRHHARRCQGQRRNPDRQRPERVGGTGWRRRAADSGIGRVTLQTMHQRYRCHFISRKYSGLLFARSRPVARCQALLSDENLPNIAFTLATHAIEEIGKHR